MGMTLIIAAAFYAKKDFATPARAATKSVVANILLNSGFVLWLNLGPASVALATGISSWVNLFFLWHALKEQGDLVTLKPLLKSLVSASLASVIGASLLIFSGEAKYLVGGAATLLPRELKVQLITFIRQAALFGVPVILYWFWEFKKEGAMQPQNSSR